MSTKFKLRLLFDDEPDTFRYVSSLHLLTVVVVVTSSSPAIEILLDAI